MNRREIKNDLIADCVRKLLFDVVRKGEETVRDVINTDEPFLYGEATRLHKIRMFGITLLGWKNKIESGFTV